MSLLEIDGLRVELPGPDGGAPRPVIHEVALSVSAGEAVGLVGESGSGKTMTLRSIVHLLPRGAVATGSVRFDGTDVLALRGAALAGLRRGGRLPGPARAHQPDAHDRRLPDRGVGVGPGREALGRAGPGAG